MGVMDAQLKAWLADQAGLPPMRSQSVSDLRAGSDARAAARPPEPPVALGEDVHIPAPPTTPPARGAGAEWAQVPARRYRPAGAGGPVVVLAHGGGWTFGSVATHDRAARRLAVATGLEVLSLDYRRAPEHPWPAAVLDVLAAVRYVRELGGDVILAGDSAGGTLAALACLFLRDAGEPQPAGQALAFPNTDLTSDPDEHPSLRENATGWGLDADDVRWFDELWVPDPQRRTDPRVSPLREPDLGGLAPAVIVTCEHDPLRDEGDAYARRLRDAGGRVAHRTEADMIHGFLTFDTVSPAAAAAGERFFADVGGLARLH